MLNIPGHRAYTCEGPTRRELMRIGSIGLMGLSLPHFFLWRERAQAAEIASKYTGARGWESAQSVVMIFLQGGPSHIDIWDPNPMRRRIFEVSLSPLRPRFLALGSASTCP
jgi:hypothetical protein